jgi:hypothetical protein
VTSFRICPAEGWTKRPAFSDMWRIFLDGRVKPGHDDEIGGDIRAIKFRMTAAAMW